MYDKEEVERLLDRSQEGVGETRLGANDYLSSFKVATFAIKDQEQEQEQLEEKEIVPEPTRMVQVAIDPGYSGAFKRYVQ